MSLLTDTCYCSIWNVDDEKKNDAILILIPLKMTHFSFGEDLGYAST